MVRSPGIPLRSVIAGLAGCEENLAVKALPDVLDDHVGGNTLFDLSGLGRFLRCGLKPVLAPPSLTSLIASMR